MAARRKDLHTLLPGRWIRSCRGFAPVHTMRISEPRTRVITSLASFDHRASLPTRKRICDATHTAGAEGFLGYTVGFVSNQSLLLRSPRLHSSSSTAVKSPAKIHKPKQFFLGFLRKNWCPSDRASIYVCCLVNFVVVIDVVCGAYALELSILLCVVYASEIPPVDRRALAWSVGELGGAMWLLRTQRKRPVVGRWNCMAGFVSNYSIMF